MHNREHCMCEESHFTLFSCLRHYVEVTANFQHLFSEGRGKGGRNIIFGIKQNFLLSSMISLVSAEGTPTCPAKFGFTTWIPSLFGENYFNKTNYSNHLSTLHSSTPFPSTPCPQLGLFWEHEFIDIYPQTVSKQRKKCENPSLSAAPPSPTNLLCICN